MKIIKSTYGTKDVTNIVESYLKNDFLAVFVSNDIFGDPNIGVLKKLTVEFDDGSIVSENENNFLFYPKPSERVGIFYTNNCNTDLLKVKALDLSLKSIKLASLKNNNVVVTSVWNKIKENPFIEIISQVKIGSHLNLILQVLQLIYFVKKYIPNAKYVSFLEHDCVYPEDYFDYDDFDCDSITNSNHIGLSKNGWQPKIHPIRPTSNVIMKLDSAIKHFQNILPHALFNKHGSPEPWYSKSEGLSSFEWTNKDWECKNPSFHINHGHSYTQHYTVFKKDFSESNYYWGHYLEYAHLFS